jgi:hypothetical protein
MRLGFVHSQSSFIGIIAKDIMHWQVLMTARWQSRSYDSPGRSARLRPTSQRHDHCATLLPVLSYRLLLAVPRPNDSNHDQEFLSERGTQFTSGTYVLKKRLAGGDLDGTTDHDRQGFKFVGPRRVNLAKQIPQNFRQ